MNDRQQKIEALAAEMGVRTKDVESFVWGISVWVNKGFSIEEAIVRHMAAFERLAIELSTMPMEMRRAFVVDTFFPTEA